MPTGYTSGVQDGSITEFRDFAKLCARGMGFTVMMRDEPFGAPLPDRFTASDWNAKQLREAIAERDRLTAMTEDECAVEAQADHDATVERNNKRATERKEHLARYNAMLAEVLMWDCPPELSEMKQFMRDQLNQSIRFDCGHVYIEDLKPTDPIAWRETKLAKARKDIEYHTEQQAKEEQRTAERNRYLQLLRESIGEQPKGE